VKKDDLPIGMMDQPQHILNRYWAMVEAGESPRLAEMLAVRKGPQLETATNYLVGLPRLETTMPAYAKKVRQQARKAGISLTDDSKYNGTLADSRGGADPNAWIHPGDGKDKVRQHIRNVGGACETLGVDFFESQQRVDTEQSRIEKLRKDKKHYRVMKEQVQADMRAEGKMA